jgi:hypothetical protein
LRRFASRLQRLFRFAPYIAAPDMKSGLRRFASRLQRLFRFATAAGHLEK